MTRRQYVGVLAAMVAAQLSAFAVLASFTASPIPWDGAFESNPANSDSVSQGAAHIRQVKAETSRRAGVDHDWGAFGNVTTDLGRHLKGSARLFLQSAAPAVDGTKTAICTAEADTTGARYCSGGELWLDTDDNQLRVALDNDNDGDADSWQGVTGFGKHTIWMPAIAMTPLNGGTGPSSPGLIRPGGGAGITGYIPLDFDATVAEGAQYSFFMPKSWDAGTLIPRYTWTADSVSTNSVAWATSCAAYADGITISSVPAQAITVDAHAGVAHRMNQTGNGTAVTVLNAAAETWVSCQTSREPTNGGDTLAADARLIGVTLLYTTNKQNDD